MNDMGRLAFSICLTLLLGVTVCKAQDKAADNYVTAMRGFYLWRCGMAVSTDYHGNHYATEACHTEDGYTDYIIPTLLPGTKVVDRIDGTGGWHDAGDYGKYTVNAGVTLGTLFYAWDHFGDKLKRISLDLPVTAKGYPEFLEELKWETDFLLKMQYPDGSGRVSHKLTRTAFSAFIMPQMDKEKRYFTEWSSAATADFVAVMAMSARYFKPYDRKYARRCLDAAWVSWKYLMEHPENKGFVQGDFSTGSYFTSDEDDRLWAAAEMWETTGEAECLTDLETRISAISKSMKDTSASPFRRFRPRSLVESGWDWGSVGNLGMWTYALSKKKGRNEELAGEVRKAILDNAKVIADQIRKDEYGCPITSFFWGCNGTAARQSVNLHVAELIDPTVSYKSDIAAISRWILGNNVYHRSFVTGLGVNPPMHPHDRRSGADGIDEPWPGYLVGGGHTPTDWVDDQEDYSRNEIAINWQAGLVYLLAARL